MIGLLQRVTEANVTAGAETLASIGRGLVVLVAIERDDTEAHADRLLRRVLTYRVFPDENGRMNRGLADTGGGLLLVPQFTLAADTRKGTRPSFSAASEPSHGEQMFERLVALARECHSPVASGRFGADMRVSLVNDGPVTFWLQV